MDVDGEGAAVEGGVPVEEFGGDVEPAVGEGVVGGVSGFEEDFRLAVDAEVVQTRAWGREETLCLILLSRKSIVNKEIMNVFVVLFLRK